MHRNSDDRLGRSRYKSPMGIDNRSRENQSDFCLIGSQPEHRLSQFERLTLVGGRELDRALLLVGRQVAQFTAGSDLAPFRESDVGEAIRFYRERRSQGVNPFPNPRSAPLFEENSVHGLADGEVVDLHFESTFKTTNPAMTDFFAESVANRTVYARWWRHATPTAGTVVAVHGWTMGDQRLNSLAFLPGLFYRLGLDVVLVELPFHGRRRSTREGVVFPSTDLALTNEALAQAIADLRSIRSIVEKRSSSALGAIGMSLGAYVASLWAGLDKLAFCIPVVPLVSMSDLAWRLVGENPHLGAEAAGVTKEVLQEVFAHHCPLSYPPQTAGECAFIIASRDDSVVPAIQPERLGAHWEGARLVWVDGGHEALFQRSQAFNRAIEFLSALGLIKHTNFADLHPVA